MRFIVLSGLLILLSFSTVKGQVESVDKKQAELVKFPEMESIMDAKTGIRVINFWATWCKPCLEELPYFEALNEKYDNVEVILVSLDFGDDKEKKVNFFIQKKGIRSKVVILDETDFNDFINDVDEQWSGAIPATLIVDNKNNKSLFFEKQFKEGELEEIIQSFLN